MDHIWNYATEAHAIEALEYYEDLLMRSLDIYYVAVVKKKNCSSDCFGLEIGKTSNDDSVIIDDCITPEEAYNRTFKENSIPKYLPVPSLYEKKLQSALPDNLKGQNLENFFMNTIHVEDKVVKKFIIDNEVRDVKPPKKNWYSHYYGGQPITIENGLELSLGGVFELEEFPNELFGITNWHLLTYSNNLGIPICNIYGKRIGEAFWKELDNNLEVAFIKIDPKVSEKIKEEYKYPQRDWTIGKPEIGKPVTHYGYGSFGNKKKSENHGFSREIYSNNATVRVHCEDFENNSKIFKNQILIENFSKGGDSGAVIVMDNGKESLVVGLLFAIDEISPVGQDEKYFSLSVANNLNLIFNKTFCQKKEVFIEKTNQNLSKTKLISQFKLVKNKFY